MRSKGTTPEAIITSVLHTARIIGVTEDSELADQSVAMHRTERNPMFRIRWHKGFGHGLTPGTTEDINCLSCKAEKAAGKDPNITGA